jgi:hypothetical protein
LDVFLTEKSSLTQTNIEAYKAARGYKWLMEVGKVTMSWADQAL